MPSILVAEMASATADGSSAIRPLEEHHFVAGQDQATIDGLAMNIDIGEAVVPGDEAETLVLVEELYGAALGHRAR